MFNVPLDPVLTKTFVGRSRGELTGIDTAGAVSNLAISKNAEITQIQIRHTAGTGGFTVEVFSDATLLDQVFSAGSDGTESYLIMNKLGVDYQNTDTPSNSLCYVKIIPEAGSGHSFILALFYKKQ